MIQGVLELKQRIVTRAIKVVTFSCLPIWQELRTLFPSDSSNTSKIYAFVKLGFVLFFFATVKQTYTQKLTHTSLIFVILCKAL